jgi:hypothetical protein
MSKAPFTTRIDEDVLALAKKLADAERRSATSLIELAILEYAEHRGVRLTSHRERGMGAAPSESANEAPPSGRRPRSKGGGRRVPKR